MKNKGFTLIELLAVIVILAIIALIATPIVLNLIEKARKGAAQDSAYGVRKAAQLYYQTSLIDSPDGLTEDITFTCTGTSCTDGTNSLKINGTIPNNGEITIKPNGDIEYKNIEINGFVCDIKNTAEVKCDRNNTNDTSKENIVNKQYESGEELTLGGYNWHIIGDNGTNVTLLMDDGQLGDNSKMAHCGSNNDASNNCTFNGNYYVYSWDKSLIRTYLNETLYPELSSKINGIVKNKICADSSRNDKVPTYGGYLIEEINSITGASCASYVDDYVRLISISEMWNLSTWYSGVDEEYPNISGVTRLSKSSDYSWLYPTETGVWWTMSAASTGTALFSVRHAIFVNGNGTVSTYNGHDIIGVRPVITIKK